MIDRFLTTLDGVAGETFTIPVSHVVQTFSTAQLQNANGVNPIACTITCEGQLTRFAYGVDPQSGALGFGALGHALFPNSSLALTNSYTITNFRFITADKFLVGDLQVTMYYEIGA